MSVMELAVKREVQIIEPAWSMPHFLERDGLFSYQQLTLQELMF